MQAQLTQQMLALLSPGFENPEGVLGCCQLFVERTEQGYGEHSALVMEVAPELRVYEGRHMDPDAVIKMPLSIFELIATHTERVDFRDPYVIGSIELEGNRDLVNYFGKLMLQPSQDTVNRLDHLLLRRCKSYTAQAIERVAQVTELEILQHLADCKPIVVTQPKVPRPYSHWSIQKLVADYGSEELRVRSKNERETVGQFVQRMQQAQNPGVKLIEGHTKAYTEGCALPPSMAADFVPAYFSLHDYIEPQIWLGNVPTHVAASSLHRDPMDGFLYQVMGRKKLLMYAPDQAPYLYPMKAYNNYQPCWVKPEEPDLEKYPEFVKAKPIEVILEPGELLIQPAGWFHVVYCLDSPTFSVSHFYRH